MTNHKKSSGSDYFGAVLIKNAAQLSFVLLDFDTLVYRMLAFDLQFDDDCYVDILLLFFQIKQKSFLFLTSPPQF